MVDYLSRENNVPLDSDYDDIRKYKLDRIIYPAGIRAMSVFEKNEDVLKESEKKAIPEFMRFNIVESEIRNVV